MSEKIKKHQLCIRAFLKTIFVLVFILISQNEAHALSSQQNLKYKLFACHRDLLYATANIVSAQVLNSRHNLHLSPGDYPIIRRDVADAFIDMVVKYTTNSDISGLKTDLEACNELASISRKIDEFANETEEGFDFYLPTIRSEFSEGIRSLRIPAGARRLITSVMTRKFRCYLIEGDVYLGPVIAAAGGGAVTGYCNGDGGRRWLMAGPKAGVALGAMIPPAGTVGIGVQSFNSGWTTTKYARNIKLAATFGLGLYGAVTDTFDINDSQTFPFDEEGDTAVNGSLGVAFSATVGFFTIISAQAQPKIVPLWDQKKWIVSQLEEALPSRHVPRDSVP